MAAENATIYPVKGQAFRLGGIISSSATGNPITGGLTVLAATISKDGGADAATTNAPVEVGTTGKYNLDLTATEMNCYSCIVLVTASNANAVYDKAVLRNADMTEPVGKWSSQTIKKLEVLWMQGLGYLLNQVIKNNNTGVISVYNKDASAVMVTENYSNDPSSQTTTKGTVA